MVMDREKAEGKVGAPQTQSYVVPDGGYGWVIVGCSFVYICLPMGIGSTFGLYYEEWLDYFNEGKVATALVGSIAAGCIPVLGALAGMVLTNIFDTRVVGMIGSAVAAVAMLLAAFADSIGLLALTYGALGGLGLGLMFNSAYLIVARYFDKKRSAATAIASSGTGFGTLFALMLRYFINEYHWRGSLILLGGVCLQALVFGMLMRPLKALPNKERDFTNLPLKTESNSNGVSNESRALAAQKKHKPVPLGDEIARKLKGLARDGTPLRLQNLEGVDTPDRVTPGIGLTIRGQLYGSGVYGMSEFSSVISVSRAITVTARMATTDGRSFASIAKIEQIQPDTESRCNQIRSAFKRSFNADVLRNPYFILVALGLTLHHMAFFIPYTYVISLTRGQNVEKSDAAYLILTFGLSNFVLKLAIGALTMVYKNIDQLYVVCISLMLSAASAMVATVCTAYWQFVLVCIVYGGMSPIVTIYVTSILVKYLGNENLTSSFSMATLIRGFGTIAGPPLAGKVIDIAGMTEAAFYVGTATDVLSLLCFVAVIIVDRRDPKLIEKRAAEVAASPTAAVKGECKPNEDQLIPTIIITCPTYEDLTENEQKDGSSEQS